MPPAKAPPAKAQGVPVLSLPDSWCPADVVLPVMEPDGAAGPPPVTSDDVTSEAVVRGEIDLDEFAESLHRSGILYNS